MILLQVDSLWAANQSLKDRVRGTQSTRWQIMADKLGYSEKEGIYTAEGNVVLTSGTETLAAQRAVYNEKTGIVDVSGNVRLESNGDVLEGERAVFDLNSRTGEITGGRLFIKENHFYISGETMEKTGPDTYRITGCRVTTCDGSTPDWSIAGSEVNVTVEGYGIVKDMVFRIRDYPFLYLPYMGFPAKTKRESGLLLPRIGFSNLNGTEVELPFYWAISDQTDATFYEHYMGDRGLMQGVEYRYVGDQDSKGAFLADVLDDKKEKDLSDSEQLGISPFVRTNDTRYWLRGRSDQALPMGLKAKMDLDYVSDQDYLREFQGGLYGFQARPDLANEFGRPFEETTSPYRKSALRLERSKADYSLQAGTAYHERVEDPVLDDTSPALAAVDFNLLPRPLFGSPLFFRFNTNYSNLWREKGMAGQELSVAPAISYPMWLGRFLEFEPSFAYARNSQRVEEEGLGDRNSSKDLYDFATRLGTHLEKTLDVQWGEVKRLKHKFSPSLIYNYRRYNLRKEFEPLFDPLSRDGTFNQIALSLDNLLDMRKENSKGEVTYGQLGRLNFIQGYNIEKPTGSRVPEAEQRDFLPLLGFLSISPAYPLTFQAEAEWDHYEEAVSYADVSLELSIKRSGGRSDTYSLDYQYLKNGSKGLNFSLHINLFHGFSVGTSQSRDLSENEGVQARYYLDYQSQCWGVRIVSESTTGLDSFMILFRLVGLGGLGSY
jgi:LPS-assembly protein